MKLEKVAQWRPDYPTPRRTEKCHSKNDRIERAFKT